MKKYEKMAITKQSFLNEEKISSSGLSGWLESEGQDYADAGITTYEIVS